MPAVAREGPSTGEMNAGVEMATEEESPRDVASALPPCQARHDERVIETATGVLSNSI